jgi:hypothetical protein
MTQGTRRPTDGLSESNTALIKGTARAEETAQRPDR